MRVKADPARVLRNIHSALRPGGRFVIQEIHACSHVHDNMDHPFGTFLYTISCMHCMSVSMFADGAALVRGAGGQQMVHSAGGRGGRD